MTDKTISAEQVAILAERVDVANQNHAELKGILLGISTQQGEMARNMAVYAERMQAHDSKLQRLFSLSDSHDTRLDEAEGKLRVHTWTWRLVGSLASVAMGLGIYIFTQFDMLKSTDNSHGNRLTMLEFIIGGRNPPATQQTTTQPIK